MGLIVRGKSVFKSELEFARSILSGERVIVINHQFNEIGEGEPEFEEEVLARHP
jgi:hypothetical protein